MIFEEDMVHVRRAVDELTQALDRAEQGHDRDVEECEGEAVELADTLAAARSAIADAARALRRAAQGYRNLVEFGALASEDWNASSREYAEDLERAAERIET